MFTYYLGYNQYSLSDISMLNKMTADMLDGIIEELQAIRDEAYRDVNFHVNRYLLKKTAEDLKSISEVLWSEEDEKDLKERKP